MVRRRVLLTGGTLAGLGLAGCAAPAPGPRRDATDAPTARLPGTRQFDVTDPSSARVWRLWLQQPSLPAPPGGYPLLVLLDGNACFPLAAQLARNAESRPAHVRPDPMIMAAIGHPADVPFHPTARQRDYTPPAPGQPLADDQGGADRLLDFIAARLLPEARRLGPVDERRTALYGHSLGGLFVLHALMQRPGLFARHVASSPSVWWNQGQVLDDTERFIARHARHRPFRTQLTLMLGELEAQDRAPTADRASVRSERRTLERTRVLARRLAALQWPELPVTFDIRPGTDHGDMFWQGLLQAMATTTR